MTSDIEERDRGIINSLQPLFENKELLSKVIEFFPYPIQIFSADGTVRMVNKSAIETIGIRSLESHLGVYNVFKDPVVQKLGFTDKVKEVLKGRTVNLTDFNAHYKDLIKYFNVKERDIQTISTDITCFPLYNTDGKIEYFAALFIIKNVYRGKEEIGLGKQYIESHWKEPFDINSVAKAACLSKAHFSKIFKSHTGFTPHEYYTSYKIEKLKNILLNTDLTIAQAFSECSMDYNGYTVKLFKDKVGATPSEYRKNS